MGIRFEVLPARLLSAEEERQTMRRTPLGSRWFVLLPLAARETRLDELEPWAGFPRLDDARCWLTYRFGVVKLDRQPDGRYVGVSPQVSPKPTDSA